MMPDYKLIEFCGGTQINDAVDELLEYNRRGEYAKGEFNGVMLYSDKVTHQNAWNTIVGMSKKEFDYGIEQEVKKKKIEEERFMKEKDSLIEYWKREGRRVLDYEYLNEWYRVVPARLNDLYRGMELECCLELVEMLNYDRTLKEVNEVLNQQNHSGMSYRLVVAMVGTFCERGRDFYEYVYK